MIHFVHILSQDSFEDSCKSFLLHLPQQRGPDGVSPFKFPEDGFRDFLQDAIGQIGRIGTLEPFLLR